MSDPLLLPVVPAHISRQRLEFMTTERCAAEYRTRKTFGIPLSSIRGQLHKVSFPHDDNPIATFDPYPLLEKHADDIREHFCWRETTGDLRKDFDWTKYFTSLHEHHFSEFSFDQVVKVWWSSVCQVNGLEGLFDCRSPLRLDVEVVDPNYALFYKICMSLWHWGSEAYDQWNRHVDAFNAVRSFDFGLEGFEVRLDFATYFNPMAWACYHPDLYLDGAFGYCIYYKGEHVLTIGFSLSGEDRLLVNQVQLRKKKGNRWLYKLPKPLMEWVLGRMQATFEPFGFKTHLIVGKEAERNIRQHHRHDKVATVSEEAYRRIRRTYEVPLSNFVRGTQTRSLGERRLKFHHLLPVDSKSRGFIGWVKTHILGSVV